MIEIREVNNKKEIRRFLKFTEKHYKDNPYYVPELYMDNKKMFKKNYMYFDQAETVFYNAYKDGEMVGRIQGIIQRVANEKNNQKRVRFTRFEVIDDQEVADKLFDSVAKWGKDKGMNEIMGKLIKATVEMQKEEKRQLLLLK